MSHKIGLNPPLAEFRQNEVANLYFASFHKLMLLLLKPFSVTASTSRISKRICNIFLETWDSDVVDGVFDS